MTYLVPPDVAMRWGPILDAINTGVPPHYTMRGYSTGGYTPHATIHPDGRIEWHVCPTCNHRAGTCDHTELTDQEHDMTSPTQRRHDEILGRLDTLIDAVRSTTARDNLHRLLAEESAAERRDEPVDVTEEPYSVRCGRAVCDDENPQRSGCHCYKDDGHDGMHGCEHADWPVDTAPDVDPDEALARVACSAFWGGQVMPSPDNESWLAVARAAREHMQDDLPNYSLYVAERGRAEKAEAEVERLTRERDEARRGPRQEPNRWCPKMLRERLCQQQTFAPDDITRDEIGGLIALLDLHRPVGPDGKHGERHTPTCGCEDDEQGQTDA